MKYSKVLNRRTFLRGAGSVIIGLPFLDAMRTSSVYANPPAPDKRLLTFFFGLGIPDDILAAGLTGPLEPLSPFASKMLPFRNLDYVPGGGKSAQNHERGPRMAFVGADPSGGSAGGASIDQIVLDDVRSEDPTSPGTLVAGTYHRESGNNRHIHSWRNNGRDKTDTPIKSPKQLFERVFGSNPVIDDPVSTEPRAARSVLDSVMEEYRFMSSDASNLGVSTRARLSDHFDRLRELERDVFSEDEPGSGGANGMCGEAPSDPGVMPPANVQNDGRGDAEDPIRVDLGEWQRLWHKMVDIYVMGLRCDRFRFGNLQFESGGERIRVNGAYEYNGSMLYSFDDDGRDRRGPHEYFHQYNANSDYTRWAREHIHFVMSQAAYYLGQLDDGDYRDENGNTILENALVVMATDLGHRSSGDNHHLLENIFHAVVGGNDCFQTGTGMRRVPDDTTATELYNACLQAMGVSQRIGAGDTLTSILR